MPLSSHPQVREEIPPPAATDDEPAAPPLLAAAAAAADAAAVESSTEVGDSQGDGCAMSDSISVSPVRVFVDAMMISRGEPSGEGLRRDRSAYQATSQSVCRGDNDSRRSDSDRAVERAQRRLSSHSSSSVPRRIEAPSIL